MKKILSILALALGSVTFAYSNKYQLNEKQVEDAFSKSTEVSYTEMFSSEVNSLSLITTEMRSGGTKTRGGYLLRSFFCGGIALHRYYMGTNRGAMWALYFCVPVAGGVAACVDFWGAVFDADFYQKYENNDKWFVWLD